MFSRTIQFDIVSPLPRRAVDERLRPVVRTSEAKSPDAIFKGELHPQGFTLRRRALFPGMLVSLEGTYIPEASGTRVVVLASGISQVMLAMMMIIFYLIILTATVRAYVMDLLFNGGSMEAWLLVPAGYLIPFIYLVVALRRARRGMERDKNDLGRMLMGRIEVR